MPVVTAVIPTHNRPELVLRAVGSALAQTYPHMEVVVIIDGPDAATETALNSVHDSRMRVIKLPSRLGGSDARNAGVEAAHGEWIAFLDDDDEWLPHKIATQMRYVAGPAPVVVASQMLVRTAGKQLVWPRKLPRPPLCEYLLSRSSWAYGEGLLQTTTLVAPRWLLLEVPFRSGLRRHQDYEWVLRVTSRPDVHLEFVPQPLAIWNLADGDSVSTSPDWHLSYDWIRELRPQITGRAYSGFIVTQVAPQAARQHAWRACMPLLAEALHADPTLFHLILFLGLWLAPRWLRRLVRHRSGLPVQLSCPS